MSLVFKDFTLAYLHYATAFIEKENGVECVDNTREITNVSFTIKDISNPIPGTRQISLAYALGELVWYWSGSNSKSFIGKFGDLWNRISDDGVTSNSSYGHILATKHGFNQINKVIELLKQRPSERRAVLNINVPNRNVITTKDEPCTIALQLLIRNNKVHMTGIMRSNDIWYGTPYDIIYFTSVQKYIARELGLETGTYTHFATSFHLYFKDLLAIKEATINYFDKTKKKEVYEIDYLTIIDNAKELYNIIDKMESPKEEIIELFIERGLVNVYNR